MKVVISEMNWPIGIAMLQAKGWSAVYNPELWQDRQRLKHELSDADGIIVRNQTQVDSDLLEGAERLQVIGRLGVGLDNIDLSYCAKRKLTVVYGKNANAISVAEYVISAVFATARLLMAASDDVKSGSWDRKTFTGEEIYGKTLGLIGIGEIGHRTAARAKALGMHVIGYDPFVAPYDFPLAETGIEMASFEEVLSQGDFISLHVPLNSQTTGLIDADALQIMKPNACLINSARGGIINEESLYHALKSRSIGSAVLDVLKEEPPRQSHPLMQLDNCIITPHIAGLTEQSQIRTAKLVSEAVICELEGQMSLCRVPLGK